MIRKAISLFVILIMVSFSASAEPLPQKSDPLHIVNGQSGYFQYESALAAFRKRYPGVTISTSYLEDEQLDTAMMANQGDIDLIWINSDYQYLKYAKQGALMPLNHNAEIMASLEHWLPGGHEILYIDGELYALPLLLFSDAFVLDGPIYRASNFTWPKDESLNWTQLATLVEAAGIGQPKTPALITDFHFFPTPLDQYLSLQASKSDLIRFDTPVFRETMEAYKRLVNIGAIEDKSPRGLPGNAIAILGSWDVSQENDSERRQLPLLGDEIAIPTAPVVLSISSYSGNAELAMRFMECLASPDAQGLSFLTLFEYFLEDDSNYASNPAYTSEDLAYRRMLIDNWVLTRSFPQFYMYCDESGILTDYYNDLVDIDQLVSILQERMDMFQME